MALAWYEGGLVRPVDDVSRLILAKLRVVSPVFIDVRSVYRVEGIEITEEAAESGAGASFPASSGCMRTSY
jgi:hypothetical protein